ncbi:hypothetical protein PO124_08445 [Bacillus licheniformis]|nr:hypothetical protein [Bacillus licheniformis]
MTWKTSMQPFMSIWSNRRTESQMNGCPEQRLKRKTAQQYKDFILAVSKVFAKDEQALCWNKASGCAKEIAYDRAVSQIPVTESINGLKCAVNFNR